MNRKLKARIIEMFDSQANFSQVTKIPEPRLSRIVRKRLVPKPEEQKRIADKLGVPVNDLFQC
jgi:hypothetical protein